MEQCKRSYVFGLAPGVFTTVHTVWNRPVEEQPDPVPKQAFEEAAKASLRLREDAKMVAVAEAHRRFQLLAQNDPLWFDPPLWVDSTSELPATKKDKTK